MNGKHKYRVGITGGIGSGKSTVCRVFEVLGLPVYYSDIKAKELIHSNNDVITLYKQLFGEDIYSAGALNRSRVAELIFANPKLKLEVEKRLHPMVRNDFDDWVQIQNADIVLNESAILFESGGFRFFDAIINVSAPENIRIKRVMKRDGFTEMEIRARMKHQWSDEKKGSLSQYVIECDDHKLIIPQIIEIYNLLVEKIK